MAEITCDAAYGTIGEICGAKNKVKMAIVLALTTPDFSFPTSEDFADKSKWETAIKEKKIFILKGMQSIESQGEDTKVFVADSGDKTKTKNAMYGFLYNFLLSLEVHKQLQDFDGKDLNYFRIDAANRIYGWEDLDGTVKGFSMSNFSTENMILPINTEEVALSPLAIMETDRNEWNKYGVALVPAWLTSQLQGLAPIKLTITTPTATGFTLNASYWGGLDENGVRIKIPITGLVTADFVLTDSLGAPQVVTSVEIANGNYTISGVGLTTGIFDLVGADAISINAFIEGVATPFVPV